MYSFFTIDGICGDDGRFKVLEMNRGFDSGLGINRKLHGKDLFWQVVVPDLMKQGFEGVWMLGPIINSPSREAEEPFIWPALRHDPDPRAFLRVDRPGPQGSTQTDKEFTGDIVEALKRPAKGLGHILFFSRLNGLTGYENFITNAEALESSEAQLRDRQHGPAAALDIVAQAESYGCHMQIADWPLLALCSSLNKGFTAYVAKQIEGGAELFPKTGIFRMPSARDPTSLEEIAAEIRAQFGREGRVVLKPGNLSSGLGVTFADIGNLETHLRDMLFKCAIVTNLSGILVVQSFIESKSVPEEALPPKAWDRLARFVSRRPDPEISTTPHQRIVRLALSYIDGKIYCHGGFAKLLGFENDQLRRERDRLRPKPGRLDKQEQLKIMDQIRLPLTRFFDFLSQSDHRKVIAEMEQSSDAASRILAGELKSTEATIFPPSKRPQRDSIAQPAFT